MTGAVPTLSSSTSFTGSTTSTASSLLTLSTPRHARYITPKATRQSITMPRSVYITWPSQAGLTDNKVKEMMQRLLGEYSVVASKINKSFAMWMLNTNAWDYELAKTVLDCLMRCTEEEFPEEKEAHLFNDLAMAEEHYLHKEMESTKKRLRKSTRTSEDDGD